MGMLRFLAVVSALVVAGAWAGVEIVGLYSVDDRDNARPVTAARIVRAAVAVVAFCAGAGWMWLS